MHVWFGLTAGKFTTQAHIEYFWETQPDTSYVLLVNEWLYLSYCCLPIISKQPDLSLLTSGINNIFSSRELPLPSPVLILEKDVWANPRRSAFSEVFRPENQHQCHVQNRITSLPYSDAPFRLDLFSIETATTSVSADIYRCCHFSCCLNSICQI